MRASREGCACVDIQATSGLPEGVKFFRTIAPRTDTSSDDEKREGGDGASAVCDPFEDDGNDDFEATSLTIITVHTTLVVLLSRCSIGRDYIGRNKQTEPNAVGGSF